MRAIKVYKVKPDDFDNNGELRPDARLYSAFGTDKTMNFNTDNTYDSKY